LSAALGQLHSCAARFDDLFHLFKAIKLRAGTVQARKILMFWLHTLHFSCFNCAHGIATAALRGCRAPVALHKQWASGKSWK
jgi:hypothetical protein